ncbi:MAG TPA: prolyl oligopeptidase family serine peptidase [Bacteroidia bacterium]|nr:prolyl oligopeptidase family serine peptidase [Bacteroidia bacterium]
MFLVLNSCQPNTQKENKQSEKEMPAPLLDMKIFFKNASKGGFRISPDGNYFSYRDDYKGRLNIFVQKVTDTVGTRVTNDTLRSIISYFWKGDRIIYLQDVGGDENFQVFSVKADGSNLKALTPFPGIRTDVIDGLGAIPGKEKELIVGINKRVKYSIDPYLLNIETGALILLYNNKENFDTWLTDNAGVLRIASKPNGVNIFWGYRNNEKDAFSHLLTVSNKDQFSLKSFDKDNKNMYALSNIGRDKVAMVEYDPIAKQEVKEIYSNKDYDLSEIHYDRKKKTLMFVGWMGEKFEKHFFDKEWEAIYQQLDKKFEGYITYVASCDDARTKAIVGIYSDRMPGKTYLYDFITKEIKEAANPCPWIIEKQMSHTKPITYTARDGLLIHGYLTLPIGLEAKNLPVIVHPHGGPWSRDEWGYDSEVQFLANRGYAVLQVNFRGGTGYGKKFYVAGFKQWGGKMQDDITDGIEWLKKEGVADPKRVAIYGGSYGGTATLMGVTFTPDLYAAGVADVGSSNMFTFLKSIVNTWPQYKDDFYEKMGNPNNPKDSVMLAKVSAALHADNIKCPVFISCGANDPRVNKAESDQMVAALRKRGVAVEYMVKGDEGHGFYNQDNKFDYYSTMEKFLDKYVKNKK